MTKILSQITILFLMTASVVAQTNTKNRELINRLQLVEDKLSLKELVDSFAVFSDLKQFEKQTVLYTEDATFDTYIYGKLVSTLKGKKQISEAFTTYYKDFETVFHMNGQLI